MRLGVIGGLGPLASAYFYELLTKMSIVEKDQDHLETIIYSCPSIPDRTNYILNKGNENPSHKMIEIAQILESQKVDLIAIPCITAHYFYDEIQGSIKIPIIHLVKELGEFFKRKKIKKVGLMATDGTISSGIFQLELDKYGIEIITPDEVHQRDVMHIIYEDVKKGKDIEIDCFRRVSTYLKQQQVEMIVLGCTELSIVKKDIGLDEFYLDAIELLSAISLKKSNMEIKKKYRYLVE